jgi:hypothetical protein
MKRKKTAINPTRYLGTLRFLYKWKMAPTRALTARFFKDTSEDNAYRRILALHRAGYIESRYSTSNEMHVWQLSQKGFVTLLPNLPVLKDEGFRSENINHDLLVAAIHLGNWVVKEPANVTLYSEQELRRYDPVYFPDWLPNKDSEHRPDGYWSVSNGDTAKLIALEVEINQKAEKRYISLLSDFYSSKKIDSILWVVKHASLAKKIQQVIADQTPGRVDAHNFSLIDDYLTHGWNAQVILGSGNKITIAKYLTHYGCPIGVRNESGMSPVPDSSPFLQLQRYCGIPQGYAIYGLGDSFD